MLCLKICDKFKWLIDTKNVLNEIRKYLDDNSDITSYSAIPVRLKTTDGLMGNYLASHKDEIIKNMLKN